MTFKNPWPPQAKKRISPFSERRQQLEDGVPAILVLIEHDDKGSQAAFGFDITGVVVNARQCSGFERMPVFWRQQPGVGLELFENGDHGISGHAIAA